MRLTPGGVTLAQLHAVLAGDSVELDPACRASVEASAAQVERAAAGNAPVYGVNTGFGKLATSASRPRTRRRCSAT